MKYGALLNDRASIPAATLTIPEALDVVPEAHELLVEKFPHLVESSEQDEVSEHWR